MPVNTMTLRYAAINRYKETSKTLIILIDSK